MRKIKKAGEKGHNKLERMVSKRTSQLKMINEILKQENIERMKIEEALRESEERYRAIFENSPIGIGLATFDGTVVSANKAMQTITGYSEEELKNMNISRAYCNQEDRNRLKKILKKDGRVSNFAVSLKRKDGTVYDALLNVALIPIGKEELLQTTCIEITEHRRAQEAVRKSEEEFRMAFENAKDAILWADPKTGLIIKCNKAAELLLEKAKNEIIGMHQTKLHPPKKEEFYDSMFKKHIEEKKATDVEAEVITKSGKMVPVHITSSVAVVGGRQIIQGIFRDITERKQAAKKDRDIAKAEAMVTTEHAKAEELQKAYDELRKVQLMLMQSEKIGALGQLGSEIAHKLNSPLSGILSLVRTYMKEKKPASQEYKDLKNMEDACEHMSKIIKETNAFARKSKEEFEILDVHDIIDSTLRFTSHLLGDNIEIKKNYGEDLPFIKGNRNQLQQVVLNMITNARDSIKGKGVFSVTTRKCLTGKGEFVEMGFSDTGCGISNENIDRIFEPFFTTKDIDKGVGLGLSIVRTIIDAHRGEIGVKSEPRKGTTFTVRLPAQSQRI